MSLEKKIEEILDASLLALKELRLHECRGENFTPIERLMQAAFAAKEIHPSHWLAMKYWPFDHGQLNLEKLRKFAPHNFLNWQLNVFPQVGVGPYTVDFVVLVSLKNSDDQETNRLFVGIECDGHEFHEKTKEQAARDKARDRYLMGQHIPVMRFTGREIWRSATGCVEEVVGYFEDLVMPSTEVA
jgi:very-short-patch-repair endonuclease